MRGDRPQVKAEINGDMAMITKYAKTVGDLKDAIKDIPEDRSWFGWDDGSLIVCKDDYTQESRIINEEEKK